MLSLKQLIYLTVFFLLSCKNEKDIESLEVVKAQIIENSFKITLNILLNETDDLSLYYTTDNSTNFKIDPIWKNVKGDDKPQDVIFLIENDKPPTLFRIDFGMNPKQKKIVFNYIVFEFNGKKIKFIGSDLGSIFRADESKCNFDSSSGLLTPLFNNGERQTPSLYPHETVMGPEIEKLTHIKN